MPYLMESLEIVDNPIVLFRGIVGSWAYYSLVRFCELMAEANPTTIIFDEIMAFADEKKSVIEAGKGSLPPDCDKGKVDELIASVMKEAGVS